MNKKMNKGRFAAVMKKIGEGVAAAARFAYEKTRHNFGLKVLSLIAAILTCNMIMTQSNPVRRMQVNGVDVVYSGLESLEARGLTLSPESRDGLQQVDVSVGVRMQEIGRMNNDMVTARVSLSSINEAGSHELTIQVYSELGTIYTQSMSTLKVEVEELVSKMVPVTSRTVGTSPSGYSVSSVTLTPNAISITGPQSAVNRVNRAEVEVDVTQMTQSTISSRNFTLLDGMGEPAPAEDLDMSAVGTIADVQVRKTVALPVNAALTLVGAERLPEGYTLSGMEVVPSMVSVSGSDTALAKVVELGCETIDIAGITEDTTYTVKLKPIMGLSYDRSTVDVVVRVEEKIRTESFTVPVQIINLSTGLTAETVEDVKVSVTGPESAVSRLRSRNITATVSAAGLGAGTHQLKLTVTLDDGFASLLDQDKVLVNPPVVTLVLSREPMDPEETEHAAAQ